MELYVWPNAIIDLKVGCRTRLSIFIFGIYRGDIELPMPVFYRLGVICYEWWTSPGSPPTRDKREYHGDHDGYQAREMILICMSCFL